MKILLVSDSHGYDDELKKVLKNVKCDLKIHCGDSCFDKNSPFIKEFAAIVDGNHDQGFFPLTATLPTALCLIEGNLNVEAMLLYLLMINFMLIFLTQEHKKKYPNL